MQVMDEIDLTDLSFREGVGEQLTTIREEVKLSNGKTNCDMERIQSKKPKYDNQVPKK